MSRRVAILRPEPGNAATAARLRDAGFDPIPLPLFVVRPLDWMSPDAAAFDGLLFTSANAVRHGGPDLASLLDLPVLAVGSATADAARSAGFTVEHTGSTDLADLLRDTPDFVRLLWLSGHDRTAIEHPTLAAIVPVYVSDPVVWAADAAATLQGSVALIHSARAGMQLAAALAGHGIARHTVRIAAISRKAAIAAGPGWDRIAVAATPDDDALIDAARALAIDP